MALQLASVVVGVGSPAPRPPCPLPCTPPSPRLQGPRLQVPLAAAMVPTRQPAPLPHPSAPACANDGCVLLRFVGLM